MDNHLCKQRVERRTGLVASIAKRIDTHARTRWRLEYTEHPARRLGRTALVHDFHVDA